ncbi:MAG: adenylate/guanylate cyclase domain-containing protein [Actinomycetota bacterium]
MEFESADSTATPGLPAGHITFLFTDLEGSTALWEGRPQDMEAAVAEHDARLRQCLARHDGYVFTTAGDSFAVAFSEPGEAVHAALAIQAVLDTPCAGIDLRCRIGIHTGAASLRDGDYFGPDVNRTARIMAAGHGGQTLLSGVVAAAMGEEQALELRDLGDHRLKDLRDPVRLLELCRPGRAESFPPLRTIGAGTNLPLQLTDLVGREEEIEQISEALDKRRLVTLTGAGGSGKTRLAIQVAAERLHDHPAGVWFVDLVSVGAGESVAREVADVLDVQTGPDAVLLDSITSAIGDRRMLLVLDNCEHVVESVGEVVEHLTRRCSQLRVIATSQRRLGVGGEDHRRVPSLTVPGADAAIGEKMASSAVQLFVARATEREPAFSVEPGDVDDVVSICRQLDGIPLAIELAAARVGVLSVAAIAERLGERFRLLTSAGVGGPARHQTLRAAMQWSTSLLAPDAADVFRRLGVFVGSFDLRAVTAVCDGLGFDEFDLLDHVTELVDRSLVWKRDDMFRLQQSVRLHALEQLDRAAERDVVERLHGTHFAGVAEEVYARMKSGDTKATVDLHRAAEDDLRAALTWAVANREISVASRIVAGVGHSWYLRGRFREGIAACEAVRALDMPAPEDLGVGVLHVYGTLLGSWSAPAEGAEVIGEEIAILRRIGPVDRLAGALNNLGNLQLDMGQIGDAEQTLAESVARYQEAGKSAALPMASLGYGRLDRGDYSSARAQLEQAQDEARRQADGYVESLVNLHLAHIEMLTGGDLDAVRDELLDCRSSFDKLGVPPGVLTCEVLLGVLELRAARRSAAAAHLHTALSEPDGHWYEAAKYWILQLAAHLVSDTRLAADLVATAGAYYAASPTAQPLWVMESFDHARAATDGGKPMDVDDAVDLLRPRLAELVSE